MNIYGLESEGFFLEAPYRVIGSAGEDEGLRQRRGDRVSKASLERINSDGDLETIKLDDDNLKYRIKLESGFCSKIYTVFAGIFFSYRDVVFGRAQRVQRLNKLIDDAFDLEDQYVSEKNYVKTAQGDIEFDIRGIEPTYYERISRYVRSVYDSIVEFWLEIFGVEYD